MSDVDSLSVGDEEPIEKMECFSNKHKFDTYSKCLKNIFDKVKKVLSKKNPNFEELNLFLSNYLLQIELDKGKELNADKYFKYIKMSLDGDNNKIVDVFLENMQILIDESLFTGDSPKEKINENSKLTRENGLQTENKVIYDVIITISKFNELNDKNITLSSLNLLHSILIHSKIGIHSEGLRQILLFFIGIYGSSTYQNLIALAQKYILEMINNIFIKMKKYTCKNDCEKNDAISSHDDEIIIDDELSENGTNFTINTPRTSRTKNLRNLSSNKLSYKKEEKIILNNSDYQMPKSNSNHHIAFNNNFSVVYKNSLERMISKELKYLVDCICINNKFSEKTNNNSTLKNNNNNLFIVPRDGKEIINNEKFNKVRIPFLVNEKNIGGGYFGWCYICRGRANYYDKKTRLPICSLECKKKIQYEDSEIDKYLKGQINEDDLGIFYFNDCLCVFKGLSDMLICNSSKTNEFNQKMKQLAFEMILEIIGSNGKYLSSKNQFIKIIKENLIENLIANCLSHNEILFKLSIDLFFKLWIYFRENLKQEIIVFNDTVFLELLDSDTSSYEEKLYILENFQLQAETPQYYIELYANYDCDVKEKSLVNRIITSLGKISQGKYLKEDHLLNALQETTLKVKALQTLSTLVNTLLNFSMDKASNAYRSVSENSPTLHTTPNATDLVESDKDDSSFFTEDSLNKYNESLTNDILNKERSIDQNLKYKNTLEKAIEKFNIKPKNGINYLKEKGFIHDNDREIEARDIATFLKNNSGLKKEFIGEILGDNKEQNLKILQTFTELFDFTKLSFTEALRRYLSTFHLPGEGQKIDRIIEQFSKKYTNDNPDYFANSDCAYYLAFAIMMLQTDMHNPNVKVKLGFDGFVNLLNGQECTKSLTSEYLESIYNDIQENPISIAEIDIQKEKMETNREDKIKLRTLRLTMETHEKLKYGKDKQYLLLCEFEYVSPLIKSIWTVLLATYSVILEETDDSNLYTICINGMGQTICLLSFLKLHLEKDAFIKGLCKVTNLSNKEFTEKEVIVIKKIFELGTKDSVPYYKGSWKSIFDVVCMLENIFFISSIKKEEREKYFNEKKSKRRGSIYIKNEKANCEYLINFLNSEIYEKIFTISQTFTNECFIDFIDSLCETTREKVNELFIQNFSIADYTMQKLIEVIQLNTNRPLNISKEIWKIASKLLIDLSVYDDLHISMRSIDSLRQLSNKYLEKKIENNDTTFQAEVIYSFKTLFFELNKLNVSSFMKKYKEMECYKDKSQKEIEKVILDEIFKLKEFAVNCFINLILNEGKIMNIQSFKVALEIIKVMSKIKNENINLNIFNFCKEIIQNFIRQIPSLIPQIAGILLLFIQPYPEEIIRLFSKLSDIIINDQLFIQYLSVISQIAKDTRENVKLIFFKEFSIIIDKKLTNKANDNKNTLTLKIVNSKFYQQLMEDVIKPIFEALVATLANNCLKLFIQIIVDLMKNNKLFLKQNFIVVLEFIKKLCIAQEEVIAVVGIESLKLLLDEKKYVEVSKYPIIFLNNLNDILDKTLQKDFLKLNPTDLKKTLNIKKYRPIIAKNILNCKIQVKLIDYLKQFLLWFKKNIPLKILKQTIECLKNCYKVSVQFNINFQLRKVISLKYIEDCNKSLGIFTQQQLSIDLYYDLLLYSYQNETNIKEKQAYKEELLEITLYILELYITQMDILQHESYIIENEDDSSVNCEVKKEEDEDDTLIEREKIFNYLTATMENNALPVLTKLEYYKEKKYSKDINKYLCKAIISNSKEIRKEVQAALELCLNFFDK